jgi:hypothetical protein
MRSLFRLLVIFVICLIANALLALPAQAICVPYDIELIPSSGIPGTEVTVHGYQFAEGRPVDIYYDGILVVEGIETDSNGDFTVVIRIPEGCTGHYQVHADVGYAEADAYFSVKPGLTVSPQKGPVGTMVTVKGRGFAEKEGGIELMYYLNGSCETIERNIAANGKGSWETSFQIPPSTRGEHEIDAQGAESKLYEVKETTFRVTAEISIDKSSGIVGDTVTMTGSRFGSNEKNIKILFDGEALVTDIEASSKGEWETNFQVPGMPAGEYSITAEGEQTDKGDIGELSFEIKPDIVLSAHEGHVGMNLTVTGCGFAASEEVVIIYDGSQVATAKTNDQGGLEASFPIPESKYGERLVTARVSGETNSTADLNPNASAIFTMESDSPPMPTLISPSRESRVGFMGEVTPTFEWSAVSDDSGVLYNLQISTSENVNASGEFVDPMVSVAGLGKTSYTLDETEALPLGTYYWIVQAVDGAENESDWSSAHSFRVGLLPLWGLIAAIAAAVVLLVLLIRALIIRRTIYYDRW